MQLFRIRKECIFYESTFNLNLAEKNLNVLTIFRVYDDMRNKLWPLEHQQTRRAEPWTRPWLDPSSSACLPHPKTVKRGYITIPAGGWWRNSGVENKKFPTTQCDDWLATNVGLLPQCGTHRVMWKWVFREVKLLTRKFENKLEFDPIWCWKMWKKGTQGTL